MAQLRRLRHPVDAGQVGVPLVRRLGPRVPLRRVGPRRPGLREVPAAAAVPGVVPAPQRCPAGLRVGLRRRQPARAGVGRARGVRHRRLPRPRVPRPGVRQAAGELHLVGEPGGCGRVEPVRGRLPRARQHRPARPLPPAGRREAGAVGRHRLDGVLRPRDGGHRPVPAPRRPPRLRPRRHVPRALRGDPQGDGRAGPVERPRRTVLRPAGDPRRDIGARRGPVDGRHHPDAGRRGRRRADARPCRAVREELRRPAGPGRPR